MSLLVNERPFELGVDDSKYSRFDVRKKLNDRKEVRRDEVSYYGDRYFESNIHISNFTDIPIYIIDFSGKIVELGPTSNNFDSNYKVVVTYFADVKKLNSRTHQYENEDHLDVTGYQYTVTKFELCKHKFYYISDLNILITVDKQSAYSILDSQTIFKTLLNEHQCIKDALKKVEKNFPLEIIVNDTNDQIDQECVYMMIDTKIFDIKVTNDNLITDGIIIMENKMLEDGTRKNEVEILNLDELVEQGSMVIKLPLHDFNIILGLDKELIKNKRKEIDQNDPKVSYYKKIFESQMENKKIEYEKTIKNLIEEKNKLEKKLSELTVEKSDLERKLDVAIAGTLLDKRMMLERSKIDRQAQKCEFEGKQLSAKEIEYQREKEMEKLKQEHELTKLAYQQKIEELRVKREESSTFGNFVKTATIVIPTIISLIALFKSK